jgi:hypothetical protein
VRRLAVETLVDDDAVELLRSLGGDERRPGCVALGGGRQRLDELLDEVLLLRSEGLESTARSMAARISLSSPSPSASRYCSTSIRM